MSTKSTPRQCVQCNINIWWDGSKWKNELGDNRCSGYAKGHKPDNKLRKSQIDLVNRH